MTRAYIGLGANLGAPLATLRDARSKLDLHPANRELAASHLYRSAAIGPGTQPSYLNAVLALRTHLAARALLDLLQELESAAGRVRGERWGPRTLDLDLLLYGNEQIATTRLSVPHPRLFERNFVLLPLAELCPGGFRFPDGSTIEARVAACPANPIERTDLHWHTAASQCSAARHKP